MAAPEKQSTTAAFIHSRLDDLGLTPIEFRVYGHVVRRAGDSGLFYESVPRCAKFCGVKITTARAALQKLAALRLLQLVETPTGKTWTYRITSIEEWENNPVHQTDGVSQMAPPHLGDGVSQRDATPPIKGTHTPPLGGTTKVIPEGNPIKGEMPLSQLEGWQLNKDINRLRELIRHEADKSQPNEKILIGWRGELKDLRAEVARRANLTNN